MAVTVRYTVKGGNPVVIRIPEDRDPFEVAVAVQRLMFPGYVPKPDPVFDAIMARVAAEREAKKPKKKKSTRSALPIVWEEDETPEPAVVEPGTGALFD